MVSTCAASCAHLAAVVASCSSSSGSGSDTDARPSLPAARASCSGTGKPPVVHPLNRAGLEQSDREGVIIETRSKQLFNKSLMSAQILAESHFIDYLHAEVITRGPFDSQQGIVWLAETAECVCMIRSPSLDGVKEGGERGRREALLALLRPHAPPHENA